MTPKQIRFVELYEGNGTEAARKAGYTGSDTALGVMANKLLKNAKITAAIKAREKKVMNPLIRGRQQRQEFWSKVMDDEDQTMKNRLRASELLGKSEADFTVVVKHEGLEGLAERMKKARERTKLK